MEKGADGAGRSGKGICCFLRELTQAQHAACWGHLSPPSHPAPPPPPPCTIQVGVVLLAEGLAHGGGGGHVCTVPASLLSPTSLTPRAFSSLGGDGVLLLCSFSPPRAEFSHPSPQNLLVFLLLPSRRPRRPSSCTRSSPQQRTSVQRPGLGKHFGARSDFILFISSERKTGQPSRSFTDKETEARKVEWLSQGIAVQLLTHLCPWAFALSSACPLPTSTRILILACLSACASHVLQQWMRSEREGQCGA